MKEIAFEGNFEAEQGILGCLLYLPDTRFLVMDRLKPAAFYYDSHRHRDIYEAMCLLHAADIQINQMTVLEQLKRKQITEIDDRPASTYLSDLFQIALYSGVADIESYVELLENAALKRELCGFLAKTSTILSQEGNAERALEQIEAVLARVVDSRYSADLIPDTELMTHFLDQLEKQAEGPSYGQIIGIPTGFLDLDALLGGMQAQELYILGGRPGTGKTSLLLNFIHYMLFRLGLRIAVFSLEMGGNDLARRLISMDTGINSQFLRGRTLSQEQMDRVVRAATERFATNRLFVDESGTLSIEAIRAKARRHQMRYGVDIVMVDYLQMLSAEVSGARNTNRVEEVGRISRGLKQLAKELKVPVLALASLNRAVEGRAEKRPQLSDLRESGSIESDADVVMFTSFDPNLPDHTIIEVVKHRNGPTGDVVLRFERELTKYHDVEG